MLAVSDTSPLVLLDKAGHLWILGKLFENVFIPSAVDTEWLRPGGYVVPQWLSVATLSQDTVSVAKDLYQKIDKGEAEEIAIFSSMKAHFFFIVYLNCRKRGKC